MSNELRKYITTDDIKGKDMQVTAFVGGSINKTSIQFTIGKNYCCLNRKQLFDLKKVIEKRF